MVRKAEATESVSENNPQSVPPTEQAVPIQPKKKIDKTARLTFIIVGAATGALLLMALIWALIANLTPTKIERVVFEYQSGGSACLDEEDETSGAQAVPTRYNADCEDVSLDKTDRAKMLAVERALADNGIKKDDEFCVNYTYKRSSSYGSSYTQDGYSLTIYWRDGTKQDMSCTAKEVTSEERARISSVRYDVENALSDGFSSSYYYDYDDYDDFYYDDYYLRGL